jgi:hypothetical protein
MLRPLECEACVWLQPDARSEWPAHSIERVSQPLSICRRHAVESELPDLHWHHPKSEELTRGRHGDEVHQCEVVSELLESGRLEAIS